MSGDFTEPRTRPVSLRISDGELSKVREIARRLGTTEAAVLRFAIRYALNELAPLHDPGARGLSLLPVFVERGAALAASFDLDVTRLDNILNENVTRADQRIDRDDLALLAMTGLGEIRVHAKLREINSEAVEPQNSVALVRAYFYKKYIYGEPAAKSGHADDGPEKAPSGQPAAPGAPLPK